MLSEVHWVSRVWLSREASEARVCSASPFIDIVFEGESVSTERSYSSGWKPEAELKQVAMDMIAIIFDNLSSSEDRRMAASTLVEVVYPEVLPGKFDVDAATVSYRQWCKQNGQWP